MAPGAKAVAKLDEYVMGVLRDTVVQLEGVQDPQDMDETAMALGTLAAHLATPWFKVDEDALLNTLQQRFGELPIQGSGIGLAKHFVTEQDIPAPPWSTTRSNGRPENLQRGRPDRKRANGAVNIAEGDDAKDPRAWRQVGFHDWLRRLLQDERVGRTRLAVAVAIGFHADWTTGAGAFPSKETIGLETGIGVRQVSDHTKALIADGWLRDTCRRHGQNGSIEYHLSLPAKT